MKENIGEKLEFIRFARVPVIKYIDSKTKIEVNLVANQFLGIVNSALINSYVQCDERFHILAIFLKYWAKQRKVNIIGGDKGFLSSYALNLMLIAYLQNLNPPVLPNLQTFKLGEGDNNQQIIHYPFFDGPHKTWLTANIYFNLPIVDCATESQSKDKNLMLLAELMSGFFRFYASEFEVIIL